MRPDPDVASSHLTDAEIARFQRRELPPEALLRVGGHLEACEGCRNRLAAVLHSGKAMDTWTEIQQLSDHLSEAEVQAHVDGRLNRARQSEVERHLELCSLCATEVADLTRFAAKETRRGLRGTWRWAGLAAAAVLVGAVGWGLLTGDRPSDRLLVFDDVSGRIAVTSGGQVSGVALPTDEEAVVAEALASGSITLPAVLRELRGPAGTLMGNAETRSEVPFGIIRPLAVVVKEDRPRFEWTPLTNANHSVVVQDQASGALIESGPLGSAGTWSPPTPLERGRRYRWQVVAATAEGEIITPRPPAPAAEFLVLDGETSSRLAQLPASHAVRGILLASAGLLEEAEREFEVVLQRNPNSETAASLLRQIREAGGRR
jgi:hypothetical protein